MACGKTFVDETKPSGGDSDGGGAPVTGMGGGGSSAASGGDDTGGNAPAVGPGGGGGTPCSTEACNGTDDDCDDMIDEGCPTTVTLADGSFDGHSEFGASGGAAFTDVCSSDAAIFRLSGHVDNAFNGVEAHCAPLVLSVDTSILPYVYRIERGQTESLGAHGGSGGETYDESCPDGTFLVGITGEDGSRIFDLAMHCAELQVVGTPGAFTVAYGPVTIISIDGNNSGNAYADLLTAPFVVDRYRGRSGQQIDGLGIGDASVTVAMQ